MKGEKNKRIGIFYVTIIERIRIKDEDDDFLDHLRLSIDHQCILMWACGIYDLYISSTWQSVIVNVTSYKL